MVDAQVERALNGGFQILLIRTWNFLWSHVLPFELIPHPPAGNHGHREFGAAEAPVFHFRMSDNCNSSPEPTIWIRAESAPTARHRMFRFVVPTRTLPDSPGAKD